MKLYETLDVDFKHMDDRGRLTQLIHNGYRQINVLETRKGVLRGGHYHKICKEAFYIISGSVDVTLSYQNTVEQVTFHTGDFFCIHPNVIHSMFFPESCVMVQMYDVCVEQENGQKDIYAGYN